MTRTHQIGKSPFPLITSFTAYACGIPQVKDKAMDDFANWRRALAGEKQPIYETEPWIGYFAVQDRSPGVKPGPRGRWPLIPCAIWRENGELVAERCAVRVPVEWVWPFAASRPIPYARYRFYHENHRWPEEAEAA
jgi:hypothetical protein